MKIGLIPINLGVKSVDEIVGLATYAESIGVESVWTFEHAMVPLAPRRCGTRRRLAGCAPARLRRSSSATRSADRPSRSAAGS